jgi:hypothetical protein
MTLDLEVNEVEAKGLTSLASVTEIVAQTGFPKGCGSQYLNYTYTFGSTRSYSLHVPPQLLQVSLSCELLIFIYNVSNSLFLIYKTVIGGAVVLLYQSTWIRGHKIFFS